MSLRKFEQDRAQRAWGCIDEINRWPDDKRRDKEEYRSWAQKVPALILTNGLGNTLAYLQAKGEKKPDKPQQKLYEHISKGVRKEMKWSSSTDLLQEIIGGTSVSYRIATIVALEFCTWLKRFAEATLPKREK